MLLEKYNIDDMKSRGFRLTADDIYSINHSSMKDAVCLLSDGATAAMISDNGLIISSFSALYHRVQQHSVGRDDILKSGFWANYTADELKYFDMTAQFLIRIQDVTRHVLEGVEEGLDERQRQNRIANNIQYLTAEAREDTPYDAKILSFDFGNAYYLFVTQTYYDLRLVAAPPENLAYFGSVHERFEAPQHAADFLMLRIYTGPGGEPAGYSIDNKPLRPRKFFPISIEGVQENDFVMMLSYPKITTPFITSHAIEILYGPDTLTSERLKAQKFRMIESTLHLNRDMELAYSQAYTVLGEDMKRDSLISNEVARTNLVANWRDREADFFRWARGSQIVQNSQNFASLEDDFKYVFDSLRRVWELSSYVNQGVLAIEAINLAYKYDVLIDVAQVQVGQLERKFLIERATTQLGMEVNRFFKRYDAELDQEVFRYMMQEYARNVPDEFQPAFMEDIRSREYQRDPIAFVKELYAQSFLTDRLRAVETLADYDVSDNIMIEADPLFLIFKQFELLRRQKLQPRLDELLLQLYGLNRNYAKGLKAMIPDSVFYPQANGTQRISYGRVRGYSPQDAVELSFYATVHGLEQKQVYHADDPHYQLPQDFLKLLENEDFGPYSNGNTIRTSFLHDAHSAKGSEGAPVIDAWGRLVGVHISANGPGQIGGFQYDPTRYRSIALDIRYALFLLDKLGHANKIIDELDIVELRN